MWSYYGRKWRIINKYPAPKHDLIIEPFAGTASYAYKYWEKDVMLVDKYDKVCKVWWYLQQAKPDDILKLPDVENGENISDKHKWLSDEERWLIGFCINNGSERPKHTAGRMNFNSWFRDKPRIAKDLHKIKHWKIINASYESINNTSASWYIDPPYQKQGKHYLYGNDIDYSLLGKWCKERIGQVIVCENPDATWLDFKPLATMNGQRRATKEVMWYKNE